MNKAYFENVLQLIRHDFDVETDLADSIMNSPELSRILIDKKLYGYMVEKGYFDDSAEKDQWKNDLSLKYCNARQLIKDLESWGLKGSFAVIKGYALNQIIYGTKEVRSFGDLDILINPSDAQRFHDVLQSNGFYQIAGPSSINGSRYSRAFLAFHASGLSDSVRNNFPVKVHQDKVEYKAYRRPGGINIEVHDGFHCIPQELAEIMLAESVSENSSITKEYDTLSLEHTFIFMLANTYENSESFYANTYDFDVNFGDYADINAFIRKYARQVDWQYIELLIRTYDLKKTAGVVLGNLDKIFGYEFCSSVLPDITRMESDWGVSILERIMDNDLSRHAALKVMRTIWETTGNSDRYPSGSFEKCRTCPDVNYSLKIKGDNLELIWQIPDVKSEQEDKYLYQLTIYPLNDDIKFTSYKIDCGFDEYSSFAYGHSTMRCTAGAVRKKTRTQFNTSVETKGDRKILTISVPVGVLNMSECIRTNRWCFRAEVFFKHFREYYHSFEKDRGTKGIRKMADNEYER